jgi:hypothetical protein
MQRPIIRGRHHSSPALTADSAPSAYSCRQENSWFGATWATRACKAAGVAVVRYSWGLTSECKPVAKLSCPQYRLSSAQDGGAVEDFSRALVRTGVRGGAPSTVLWPTIVS